jgi:Ca-activated chloride channel family protein
MKRHASLLILMMLLASTAQASMDWSSLWRTADQRGEHLLQTGDAATAAKTYSDPRRKAFAELKAGDNEAAAHDFAVFDDSDAHYNRGNALARAGQLEDALKAYDTALARDPQNADAKKNRELVAQALEQQKKSDSKQDQQQSGDKNSKGQQDGKNQSSQDHGDQKQGDQKQGDPERGDKKQGDEKQDGSKQDSKSASDSNGQSSQPQSEQQKGGAAQQQAGKDQSSKPSQEQQAASATPKPDDAEQARRDAEAGLKKSDNTPANAAVGTSDTTTAGGKASDVTQAPALTEKQLAEDQWLRQIPDDPGGLLRRKFMNEYLSKHQQQPPQQP